MYAEIDYERLYRDTIPSVVSIYVGRRGPAMGAGSGFVYDATAAESVGDADTDANEHDARYVVTNEHVVRGDTDVEIRFADGQWRTGRVVGRDAYTDLAVVRIPDAPETARPLPVATENPTPGRPVAALGNPLGLDGSISAGIVSGANRSMPTSGGFAIPDVVQTDAPINPGNSGGPLVALAMADDDPAYEVVGVNRARQGDNIGFAVSPAIVTRVVPSLVAEGRYGHSYLRTRTLDVTPTVATANGLDEARGVLVVDVATGPAAGDRLRRSTGTRIVRGQRVPTGGDVIVGINGRELRSHEELMRYLITETRPREPVEIDVIRDGNPRTLSVVLGERPDPDGRIPVG
jgi:S1-C subfamily serine protease